MCINSLEGKLCPFENDSCAELQLHDGRSNTVIVFLRCEKLSTVKSAFWTNPLNIYFDNNFIEVRYKEKW